MKYILLTVMLVTGSALGMESRTDNQESIRLSLIKAIDDKNIDQIKNVLAQKLSNTQGILWHSAQYYNNRDIQKEIIRTLINAGVSVDSKTLERVIEMSNIQKEGWEVHQQDFQKKPKNRRQHLDQDEKRALSKILVEQSKILVEQKEFITLLNRARHKQALQVALESNTKGFFGTLPEDISVLIVKYLN
jgi:hypothetical protein